LADAANIRYREVNNNSFQCGSMVYELKGFDGGIMFEKFRPLYDRVLIERSETEDEKSAGGIIIPDAAKEKPQVGVVKAIGTGRLTPDGKVIPLQVKVGDKVFYGKYAGTEASRDLLVIREDEILGVFG
jgi:chaperonin GroES